MKDEEIDIKAATAVMKSGDDSFESLAKAANLNPKMDFRYADLSFVKFGNSNLSGYDFTGANLRNADFSGAKLENTKFDYADLLGAQWPVDDLRNISYQSGLSNQDLFIPDHNESWKAIDENLFKEIFKCIYITDNTLLLSPESTCLYERELSFYPGVKLICIQDINWNIANLRIYYLVFDGNIYRLNGASTPIHQINSDIPIAIDKSNILDYLRFFCFFVRSEEGPFMIIEGEYDYFWLNDLDETSSSVIGRLVRPASVERIEEEETYICSAIIFYSSNLFLTEFSIKKTGRVDMLDDVPIAVDLPTKVDAPLMVSKANEI